MKLAAATTAAAVALVPLAWVVWTALRLGEGGPTLDAFDEVARTTPLARWTLNGVFIAATQTTLAVFASATCGYLIGAFRFRGRGLLVAAVALTAVLPGAATVTGLFSVVAGLGGVDTYWAATLPGVVTALGVFIYASAVRSVPRDVFEAARLDGCGETRMFWTLALPLCRPATAAFVLLHFLAAWNAVLWPTAVLADDARRPLAAGLAETATSVAFESDPSLPAAAVLVGLVPVGLLFITCATELTRERDA